MRTLALIPAAVLALLFGIACGGGDDDDATPAATPTLAVSVGSSGSGTPTPGASATPSGSVTPTATVASRLPAILYMRTDNVGAGAINVIVATNTDTTAKFEVRGAPGASVGGQNPPAGTRQPEHLASVGTANEPLRVEVTLTDSQGRSVTGAMEVGSIVGRQWWGRGDSAPKLTMLEGRKARATWVNLKPAPGDITPGSVILFASKTGCSPFRPCAVNFIGAGGLEKSGVSADGVTEAHQVDFDFADNIRDYIVVLTGRPSATAWEFYQFFVAASEIKP